MQDPSSSDNPQRRCEFTVETMEPLIVLSASAMCAATVAEYAQIVETPQCDFDTSPSCSENLDPSEPTSGGTQPDLFDSAEQSKNADPAPEDCDLNDQPDASELVQDSEALIAEIQSALAQHEATKDIQFVFEPATNETDGTSRLSFYVSVDTAAPDTSDCDVTAEPPDDSMDPACPVDPSDPVEDFNDDFRTIDGTYNNLNNDTGFGVTGSELLRLADADYADGASAAAGEDRESPRLISNLVADQEGDIPNGKGISDYVWIWGQFIDHDIDLTQATSGESLPIAVPQGDPFFDPTGTGTAELPFQRSGFEIDDDGVRQQTNSITAFIDASQVYGSDSETQSKLRAYRGGNLDLPDNLLPQEVDQRGGTAFLAGDIRAGENIALTSIQTLFAREHNRLAAELAETDYAGQDLSDTAVDEEIYQRARAIVGAQLQHITYNEYLPMLLGDGALSEYKGYDATVDPSIATEFSTAAYRFGHTTLSAEMLRLDPQGNEIEAGHVSLRDAFFATDKLIESGIDPILQGAAAHESQKIDPYVVDDLRNFLFGQPGQGGMDLASLNIQRGRDHGLASYNDTREALGLERLTSFDEVSSDAEVVARLSAAYTDVDAIDLWVGGLAEDHVAGGNLGITFHTIVADQFERIRDGDRYWYENALSESDLASVKATRLSDVIRRNTTADTVQDNVFVVPDDGTHYA